MLDDAKKAERAIANLESRLVNIQVEHLLSKAVEVSPGVKLISAASNGASVKELELLSDRLKEKDVGVVVVGGAVAGKAVIIAAVNPVVSKSHKALSAGNIVKQVCELVDGKGGGRPDFARGGGNAPEKLPQAMAAVAGIVAKLANP
jgi:alanyl-tRNA synthetase